MTHWNYRVFRKTMPGPENSSLEYLEIHEVYYKDNEPESISTDPIVPYGETSTELAMDLTRMLEAIGKPFLNYSDFEPNEMGSIEPARASKK